MANKEKKTDKKPDRSDYFLATPADFVFSGKGKDKKEE